MEGPSSRKPKAGQKSNASSNTSGSGSGSKAGNLYEEAAEVLNEISKKGTSGGLRTIIYNNNSKSSRRSDPRQMYALVSSTLKFRDLLTAVIKASGMLRTETKTLGKNLNMTMLMVHDLLLTKSGRITTKKSLAKDAVLRHKTRLKAELVKYKVKHKIQDINSLITEKDESPVRWIRINTIRANLKEIETFLMGKFKLVESWSLITPGTIFKDIHVQNLYGIHPSEPIAQMEQYKTGKIIIQDRASCFPATILAANFKQFDKTIISPAGSQEPSSTVKLIDACSAPGNKTTHLTALSGCSQKLKPSQMYRINAFERDQRRSQILKKMIGIAGANSCVDVVVGDFTQSNPQEYPEVVGILVDPSCSGSGIFGREFIEADEADNTADEAEDKLEETQNKNELERLHKLAGFQFKIVKHALSFSKARVVVYSTCSIHAQENEHVVERLLLDPEVKSRGWRVTTRKSVLPDWPRRGIPSEFSNAVGPDLESIADGCIRALPKQDGGIGFFAVCFERTGEEIIQAQQQLNIMPPETKLADSEEEEWTGFDD